MLNDENTRVKQALSAKPNPRVAFAQLNTPNRVHLTRNRIYRISCDNDIYCQVSYTGNVAEFNPPHAPKVYGRQPELKGTEFGAYVFIQAVAAATDVMFEEKD